ncbi:hypothetical protein [Actinomycetospora chiangmaiensis]|uniref:hypothetical protein n=1 Tax=Actinomycetospora chiangmaiensis TaxID=402650 RepID=UPI0003787728|nr:hypothetical protein [Actinomycetospora chiangmaiensis]
MCRLTVPPRPAPGAAVALLIGGVLALAHPSSPMTDVVATAAVLALLAAVGHGLALTRRLARQIADAPVGGPR